MFSQGNSALSDLEIALKLADIADEISMQRYLAIDLVVETKPDLTPVSDADRAVEQAIREYLGKHRSNDAIIGEEFGTSVDNTDRAWIIDPIDGTKNYVRGVPVWATLIALRTSEGMQLGVVSSPALGRRWYASKGNGAFVIDNLASPGDPRGGPNHFKLFGQAGPILAKSNKFYLGLRQQPTPGGVGCCGWG